MALQESERTEANRDTSLSSAWAGSFAEEYLQHACQEDRKPDRAISLLDSSPPSDFSSGTSTIDRSAQLQQ